jgi:hypothetical protein
VWKSKDVFVMERRTIKEWTREELLRLPVRSWDAVGKYKSIVIVPTDELHDSGWRLMAIIGCDDDNEPKEIAAFCDDIQWLTPRTDWGLNCDMLPRCNCMRFHSWEFSFVVGMSLSTTEVHVKGNGIIL